MMLLLCPMFIFLHSNWWRLNVPLLHAETERTAVRSIIATLFSEH